MKTLYERLIEAWGPWTSPPAPLLESEILDEHGDKERQLIDELKSWEALLLRVTDQAESPHLAPHPSALTIRAIIEKVYGGGG